RTRNPMYRLPCMLVLALTAFFLVSGAASADISEGTIRGTITDGSGGALPGVTVTATSIDRQTLATTVTDAMGAYELPALPVGSVGLTFQLDGFATADASVALRPYAISIIGSSRTWRP